MQQEVDLLLGIACEVEVRTLLVHVPAWGRVLLLLILLIRIGVGRGDVGEVSVSLVLLFIMGRPCGVF